MAKEAKKGPFEALDVEAAAVHPRVREAMSSAGYEPTPTGGGFTAWRRDLPNGDDLRISADPDGGGGSISGDPEAAVWYACRTAPDNGFAANQHGKTLKEALAFAKEIPSPRSSFPDIQAFGESADELAAAIDAHSREGSFPPP